MIVPAIAIDVPGSPCGPSAPVSPRGITKTNSAAADVPSLVTLAFDPAAPVVVLLTATVAAAPGAPAVPASPLAPAGIPKSKEAAEEVPVFTTVAFAPAASVVVEPTSMVAAVPSAPAVPGVPGVPGNP